MFLGEQRGPIGASVLKGIASFRENSIRDNFISTGKNPDKFVQRKSHFIIQGQQTLCNLFVVILKNKIISQRITKLILYKQFVFI